MSKKQAEELSNDILIADAILRIFTLEKLLIDKGVFTKEEFNRATAEAATNIAKVILQRANISGDIDELVRNLPGYRDKFE